MVKCHHCKEEALEGRSLCERHLLANREQSRRWREANREKTRTAVRRWREANPEKARGALLAFAYGISNETYNAMFTAQGGVCAICHQPETAVDHRTGAVKRLSVDHCHTTGQVRALLCNDCNTTIGKMGEDPTRLRAAADYLEQHPSAPNG